MRRNDFGYVEHPQTGPLYHYGGEDTWVDWVLPYLLGVVLATVVVLAVMLFTVPRAQAQGAAPVVVMQASWYSRASLVKEGTWRKGEQMMANGKRFDETALTCAARRFDLGAVLRVTNVETGRSVRVVVTDRIGKRFAQTRVDLARGAFEKIADLKKGVVRVRVEVVS